MTWNPGLVAEPPPPLCKSSPPLPGHSGSGPALLPRVSCLPATRVALRLLPPLPLCLPALALKPRGPTPPSWAPSAPGWSAAPCTDPASLLDLAEQEDRAGSGPGLPGLNLGFLNQ